MKILLILLLSSKMVVCQSTSEDFQDEPDIENSSKLLISGGLNQSKDSRATYKPAPESEQVIRIRKLTGHREKQFRQRCKVQLDVYIESQCPDTIAFVKEQLVPAVKLLHRFLKINFIPFGKAYSLRKTDRGQQYIEFQCQHGPAECLGNRIQDCALHSMETLSDEEKTGYIACEMDRRAAAKGNYWCVYNAGLNMARVRKCVNSKEGTELQLDSEAATKRVNLKFVPTIVINGKFNQQIQDRGLYDLTGTLCSMMPNTPPCANRYYNFRQFLGYDD